MAAPDQTHRYPSAIACKAAGITPAILKNWTSRKPEAIKLEADERVQMSEGVRFAFSAGRIFELALIAELGRFGIGPRDARVQVQPAVQRFSAGWTASPNQTLLIVRPGEASDLIVVDWNTPFGELVVSSLGSSGWSGIFLSLNEVWDRIMKVLADADQEGA